MKGKFVIIDLRNMDYMKDHDGKICYYDTEEEASDVCGMYELEDSWVCKLMYNHKEDEILSYADLERKEKLDKRTKSINKIIMNESIDKLISEYKEEVKDVYEILSRQMYGDFKLEMKRDCYEKFIEELEQLKKQ